MVKKSSKGKGKRTVKPSSSSQPAETKRSQLVGEVEQPRSELFEIIAEIKDRLTKQQEEDKAMADASGDHKLDEEDQAILKQAGYLVESSVHDDFSNLLMQDDNISEIPNFDEENVQESIQRYRKHMKHLQETNDGY